ncbi:3-methylornithyl-N6-L-lysine dehydrogenase PylD [Desulfocicer niacini]
MTRLKTCDIDTIAGNLNRYNVELIEKTGQSLLGVACHACGRQLSDITPLMEKFTVGVVPVTAGQGIITTFSHTVKSILAYLGFPASVTEATDTAGLAEAFEAGVRGIMMSDDSRFVALNLNAQRVVDNSVFTGRGYAAALDLMAGGLKGKTVGVVGCGPVGSASAGWLMDAGAHVVLYDVVAPAARRLRDLLSASVGTDSGNKLSRISVAGENGVPALHQVRYLLDATPVANAIPDTALSDTTWLAAPGVPLGISPTGYKKIASRLVHDKLEIGVASMAVAML